MTERCGSTARPISSAALAVAAAAALALALGGCRGPGTYLWVDDVPKSATAEAPYAIGVGDLIGVRVWNQEANSIDRTRVREDGRISLPFLNDVEVAGQNPADLARRLEAKLKAFIVNPVVTVVVHERRPTRVSVLGQVVRPGVYDLDAGAGVLHALAAAGGVTPFASDDGIYVLRTGPGQDSTSPARIRFRYRDLRAGKVQAVQFRLHPTDVVVVE